MKKHSSVPNAIKNLKQMATFKLISSAILSKNATFVYFAVMAHILKETLINMF
jgi:hypothetical protein